MSLLEVRRGVLGGELEQSGQRVQTFRAPPSRVRRPAEETWPSRPLPPEPRSRRSPATGLPEPRARNTEGCPASPAPAAHPPAGPCPGASSRPRAHWRHALQQAINRSAPEGHAPAAKTDPLLLPATLSSNQPPIPSLALRDCLLLSHHSCPDQESHARRL